jgi:hypothetical protein
MNSKLFLLGVFLILLPGLAAAEVTQQDLDQFREVANSNTDKIPDFVETLVGNQNINIHLEDTNQTVSIQTTGTAVAEASFDSWNNPTLVVWTEEATVQELMNSTTPRTDLEQALESGDISYEVNGLVNQLKFFFAQTIIGL